MGHCALLEESQSQERHRRAFPRAATPAMGQARDAYLQRQGFRAGQTPETLDCAAARPVALRVERRRSRAGGRRLWAAACSFWGLKDRLPIWTPVEGGAWLPGVRCHGHPSSVCMVTQERVPGGSFKVLHPLTPVRQMDGWMDSRAGAGGERKGLGAEGWAKEVIERTKMRQRVSGLGRRSRAPIVLLWMFQESHLWKERNMWAPRGLSPNLRCVLPPIPETCRGCQKRQDGRPDGLIQALPFVWQLGSVHGWPLLGLPGLSFPTHPPSKQCLQVHLGPGYHREGAEYPWGSGLFGSSFECFALSISGIFVGSWELSGLWGFPADVSLPN